MSGRHGPRRAADQRRRELGQNLLVDQAVVTRAVRRIAPAPDDLIVEIGPGRGALTLALARTGARLIAVERDPAMIAALRSRLADEGLVDQVRVICCDVRRFRWPRDPYRVVGNIPFGVTTAILERLLDDPAAGPWRADLLMQAEVARKRAANPAHVPAFGGVGAVVDDDDGGGGQPSGVPSGPRRRRRMADDPAP